MKVKVWIPSSRAACSALLCGALLFGRPEYFTPEHKPEGTSEAEWQKARNEVETAAKATLASRPRR